MRRVGIPGSANVPCARRRGGTKAMEQRNQISQRQLREHKDHLFMTVKEVAEYLRLAEITIYRLAESKDLPGSKAGRQWRFKRCEVDQWLKWRRR